MLQEAIYLRLPATTNKVNNGRSVQLSRPHEESRNTVEQFFLQQIVNVDSNQLLRLRFDLALLSPSSESKLARAVTRTQSAMREKLDRVMMLMVHFIHQ